MGLGCHFVQLVTQARIFLRDLLQQGVLAKILPFQLLGLGPRCLGFIQPLLTHQGAQHIDVKSLSSPLERGLLALRTVKLDAHRLAQQFLVQHVDLGRERLGFQLQRPEICFIQPLRLSGWRRRLDLFGNLRLTPLRLIESISNLHRTRGLRLKQRLRLRETGA